MIQCIVCSIFLVEKNMDVCAYCKINDETLCKCCAKNKRIFCDNLCEKCLYQRNKKRTIKISSHES
jgi:hypothetical protein